MSENNFPAWPGGMVMQGSPEYVSPLLQYRWQTYDMEELIRLIAAENPSGKYDTYITQFEARLKKLGIPKEVTVWGSSNNKPNDFGLKIHTTAVLNQYEIDTLHLYIVTGKDGAGLRSYFKMIDLKETDLVFFLEDNTDDISEPVLLCAMGKKWQIYFTQLGVFRKHGKVFPPIGINFPGLDQKKFLDLLLLGEIKGYPWLKSADKAGKAMYYLYGIINYGICWTISEIISLLEDALDEMKIAEKGWLPSSDKNEKFIPALIPGYVKEAALLDAAVIAEVLKGIKQLLTGVSRKIDEILKNPVVSGTFIKEVIGGFLEKMKSFADAEAENLGELAGFIQEFGGIGTDILNAFLCGVVNGFIDGIKGLADVLKWIFDAGKQSSEILDDLENRLPGVLELFDNLREAWKIFSFKEFFSALKKSFLKFLREVFSELSGNDSALMYRLAYFTGNAVGFIIEFIVELIATGGAGSLGKFLESLGSMGENALKRIQALVKAAVSIVQDTSKTIEAGLLAIVKFLEAGTDKMVELFDALFAELKTIFGIGFKPATEELFEKLGITWERKRLPVLNSGLPVKLGENNYGLFHKGVVVMEGTKEEVEIFAKKLTGSGEDAAEKSLEELFQLKRFVKSVYGESELSKAAIKFRKTLKVPKHNGNIAIFEYLDQNNKLVRKEFSTLSKEEIEAKGLTESPHAEIAGLDWIKEQNIPFENVKNVYTELEPCIFQRSLCKKKLALKCKNAKIEYSFYYPGTEIEPSTIRRAALKEREIILKKLLN